MQKFIAGFLTAVVVLVLTPFVMLYEYLGPGLFWLAMTCLVGVCAALWHWRRFNRSIPRGPVGPSGGDTPTRQSDWQPRQPTPEELHCEKLLNEKRAELQREAQEIRERRWRYEHRRRNIHKRKVLHDDGLFLEVIWSKQLLEIKAAWNDEDWDFVRTWLQKYAYVITANGASEEEHNEFKAVMLEFTKIDPLFDQIMNEAAPLIQAEPGVLQSILTKTLQGQFKADDIRYALYFAAESGQITRVKKGRSYQLYLAQ